MVSEYHALSLVAEWHLMATNDRDFWLFRGVVAIREDSAKRKG